MEEVTFELALKGWDFDKGRCFLSKWNDRLNREIPMCRVVKKKELVHRIMLSLTDPFQNSVH